MAGCLYSIAPGAGLPVVKPGSARYDYGVSHRSIDVGAAEDDDADNTGPPAEGTERDDAMDDADNVCYPRSAIPQRLSPLLGHFHEHQGDNAVFCYRLGRSEYSEVWETR